MTWEAGARSGGAAESWVAYAMGVNDFDVGQMIGGKAQSTDLLVSKDRNLWRIEVKSSSQGPTQASFKIQNPISNDKSLVYAFVFFNVKQKKQTLSDPPKLFFVRSTDLEKLEIEKSYDEEKKKEVWEVPYQGNFLARNEKFTKHKDNWEIFKKSRKKRYLPEDTDKLQLINSYHRLFVSNNMGYNAASTEIMERKKVDVRKLEFKKKYTQGDTFPSISETLGVSVQKLKRWRDQMQLPKRK